MINIHKLDKNQFFTPEGERHLLEEDDPEEVRNFFALSGPARLEYAEKMAEAEAMRIVRVRKAQAEGIREIRKAEADGLKMIGDAIAESERPELVAKLAELVVAQDVAHSLAEGKATKLFLSDDHRSLFGLAAALGELLRETPETDESKTPKKKNGKEKDPKKPQ